MRPRMMWWPRGHARGECCCGPRAAEGSPSHHHFAEPGWGGFGGGSFGVRRPLRFLGWKLGLDERQVAELAGILNELKTERAQAEVDDRRSLALLADAVSGESFDEAKANEAAKLRVESAQRLQSQVARALGRIYGLLDAEQRTRLAYLIRTGTVTL